LSCLRIEALHQRTVSTTPTKEPPLPETIG
jgi:hypothetical protein